MIWKPSRLTKTQLEERRTVGFEMLDTGFPPTEIAQDLGVSRQVVHQWKKTYDQHGLEAAKAKPHPGTKKIITHAQLQELKTCILEGALKHGFPSDAWTCPRVGAFIQTRFSIEYSVRHVGYILHDLGFSPQKPDTRALKRTEPQIETWTLTTLAELKKNTTKATPSFLVMKQDQHSRVASRTRGD